MPLTNSSVESTQLRKQSMNLKQVNEYKSPKQAQEGKRMKKQQKQSEESIKALYPNICATAILWGKENENRVRKVVRNHDLIFFKINNIPIHRSKNLRDKYTPHTLPLACHIQTALNKKTKWKF